MYFIRFDQPYVAINSRACIPAAVQPFINDFDSNDVGNAGGIAIFIYINLERDISVGVETCFLSVYPYFCLIICTFKVDGNDFACILRLENELFSIPSFTAYSLSRVRAAYAHAGKRTDGYAFSLYGDGFDTPVMREVEHSPSAVVEGRLFGVCNASAIEFPMSVHVYLTYRSGNACRET